MSKGIHVFETEVTYVSNTFAYELPNLAPVQVHILVTKEYVVEDSTLELCHIFEADNE